MRIARVLTRLNFGGPARQVLASDPLLVRRGHELRIFVGTPEAGEGDLFESARGLGLDLVRVPGLARGVSLAGDLRARAALRTALDEFDPDVLHTHASKAGALGRSATRRRARTARVHTFHGHVLEGYFPRGVSRGLAWLERRLARDTDRVVAVSHATADDLVRLGVVAEEKIVVVPPGIDLTPFEGEARRGGALRAGLGVGPDARIVGVVGRLADVKRPEWALDVFALLAERHPELHLAFVGDGELRRFLERRVAALDAPRRARVHLVGAVESMPAVLADLFAVLSTSRSEGMPVALIEAGAAGVPVVATAVGGTAEIVAHERTGFLGASVDDLAFGLAQLLDSPGLALAMGRRARVRVAERHGAAALATRLERLYETVIEERRCAS